MGNNESVPPPITADNVPKHHTILGLGNLGNTCYVSSVLQTLYHIVPFRNGIIMYYVKHRNNPAFKDNLAYALGELFYEMNTHSSPIGSIYPVRFIGILRKSSQVFQSTEPIDGFEFLQFLFEQVNEILEMEEEHRFAEVKRTHQILPRVTYQPTRLSKSSTSEDRDEEEECMRPTLIDRLYNGVYSVRLKCVTCETSIRQFWPFLHISIPIRQNCSVYNQIQRLRFDEIIHSSDRDFFCHVCGNHQNCIRTTRIMAFPNIVVVHLKRFRYDQEKGRIEKDSSYVEIPKQIRFGCVGMSDGDIEQEQDGEYDDLHEWNHPDYMGIKENEIEMEEARWPEIDALIKGQVLKEKDKIDEFDIDARMEALMKEEGIWADQQGWDYRSRSAYRRDPLYNLVGFVVHIGSSLYTGHYVSVIKTHGRWYLFNDKTVYGISDFDLPLFYGKPNPLPAPPPPPPCDPRIKDHSEDALHRAQQEAMKKMGANHYCRGTAYILFYRRI
ncbi:putative Ubiquitin carboxyl-terminal hydrolase 3 [Blattamonas nauphoetae]|uniref:Ubiquitin carboxyl-terminal hydrolase n=1 Tax=Blattamonas nauphoetae TaxID=2049346 RepID=A0ABQ9YCR3_9EUKA|nr:putative Ubiquitin carboxyl-terminal hydrolase 3 [Blattamonas nauphoetae]